MTDPRLSGRCLEAAQTLEEMGELYDFLYPASSEWSAIALRREAEVIAEEDL